VKQLSGAPLEGRLLALPANIRLDWRGLPGTYTLAYYKNTQITTVKSFKVQAPGSLQPCPKTLDLGRSETPQTNALAFHGTELITAVKSFMV